MPPFLLLPCRLRPRSVSTSTADTALCLVCLQNFSKSAAGKKTDDRVSERAATESTQSFRRSYTCKDLKGFVLSDDWWATVQKVTHLMVRVLFCWPVE